MSKAVLEHLNVTVSDPARTAQLMSDLFDWKIRWQGESKMGGHTVHVGEDDTYLALYTVGAPKAPDASYHMKGGLNHIGVVVDDLDAVEAKVKDAGYKPHNHGDYEPGRRFYFHDHDGIEFEIVSYAEKGAGQ